MAHPEGISVGVLEYHPTLVGADKLYAMCPDLVATMDPFDAAACFNAGDNPRHMLERLLVLSTNKFGIAIRGRVAAMMGTIVRIRDRELAEAEKRTPAAQFWLICGVHVADAPWGSRRLVRHVTSELCKHYDSLYGYIDVGHDRMLRLAEWLGGELAPPAPFGESAALFHKFTLRS